MPTVCNPLGYVVGNNFAYYLNLFHGARNEWDNRSKKYVGGPHKTRQELDIYIWKNKSTCSDPWQEKEDCFYSFVSFGSSQTRAEANILYLGPNFVYL